MNKLTRNIILATAALATIATSLEFASAGDRNPHWRRHHPGFVHERHHGRFRDRAFVAGALGVTAGVIIGEALARPRVIYRERPVVIDEEPVFVEPETVYADPDYEDAQPVDRLEGPVEYQDRVEGDRPSYDDDDRITAPNMGEDYFPSAPERRHDAQRDQDSNARRQTASNGNVEPWTEEWRNWCNNRYQTFNEQNGTYKGYDGRSHFCTVGG